MSRARQHNFQVLTKRSERLETLAKRLPWPSNVWIGVSVESAAYAYRIEHLRHVPPARGSFRSSPCLPMSEN
jgi:protein gp37